jgi:hypothetical protein
VDPPLSCCLLAVAPSTKLSLQTRQEQDMHTTDLLGGLDVKHKSDNIDEIYVFRDGESIFFININTNQLTMISEIGHRSTILILGSSSSFCPPTAAA